MYRVDVEFPDPSFSQGPTFPMALRRHRHPPNPVHQSAVHRPSSASSPMRSTRTMLATLPTWVKSPDSARDLSVVFIRAMSWSELEAGMDGDRWVLEWRWCKESIRIHSWLQRKSKNIKNPFNQLFLTVLRMHVSRSTQSITYVRAPQIPHRNLTSPGDSSVGDAGNSSAM